MVCFCKDTMSELERLMPMLDAPAADTDPRAGASTGRGSNPSAGPDPGSTANGPIGHVAELRAVAAWLAQFGLPAPPWTPDPAWLNEPLPKVQLSASAVATLQAFAQLQVLALSLGMNLMVAAQATAFARLVTTLNARLAVLRETAAPINPAAWVQLSAAATTAAQVTEAVQRGLLDPTPPPMGPPLSPWRPFLSELRALLPVIAIANQLQLDLSASLTAQLAPILRTMLRIPMPAMTETLAAALSLTTSLTAALAAVAQLKLALGVDPLAAGLPAVRKMVAERVADTASRVEQAAGKPPAAVAAALPRVEYCPTLMAPPAVVEAALSLNLPPMTWQIPVIADVPVLNVGLPMAAFSAQLKGSLGLGASATPCGPGCDASALMAAANA